MGFVHANAGVDRSNIASDPETEPVLLLPYDPDASARRLREGLECCFGVQLGVIINDTSGRAWRNGLLGLAIGVSGFTPLENLIGDKDLFERELQVTEVATADEMAAGASLLMGQKDEKTPIVLVRVINRQIRKTRDSRVSNHCYVPKIKICFDDSDSVVFNYHRVAKLPFSPSQPPPSWGRGLKKGVWFLSASLKCFYEKKYLAISGGAEEPNWFWVSQKSWIQLN